MTRDSDLDRQVARLTGWARGQSLAVAQVVTEVIEDLDVAAMKQGMGRRAFRLAASDAAMGLIRPSWPTKPSDMAAP